MGHIWICLIGCAPKFQYIFVAPKIHYFAPKINIFSFVVDDLNITPKNGAFPGNVKGSKVLQEISLWGSEIFRKFSDVL